MKVLQIHFWGDASNLTGSVEKVIDSFARMQFPDIELAIASLSSRIGRTVRHGKTYHTFVESRWRNRLFNKLLGLGAFTFPSLVRLIESLRPDVLHLHNRQALADPLVARLTYRPRVVCHYHRRFGAFAVPGSADMLLAVSEAVRRALLEATGTSKPACTLHNPVPSFAERPRASARAPGPLRLLYAGGRERNKGFDELLPALAPLHGRTDVEIELCGPRLEGMQAPAANARVLGMLPHDEFRDRLDAADIVVMPSHFEGFPLLALEAMASGKLLVATRAGGLAEIVSPDCAVVSEIGSAPSLAACLLQAIGLHSAGRRDELAGMLEAARRRASGFSLDRINEQLADYYRSVISG